MAGDAATTLARGTKRWLELAQDLLDGTRAGRLAPLFARAACATRDARSRDRVLARLCKIERAEAKLAGRAALEIGEGREGVALHAVSGGVGETEEHTRGALRGT